MSSNGLSTDDTLAVGQVLQIRGTTTLASTDSAAVETRSTTYVVRRGDTLYSIARAHGVDHRDLARWNNIANPAAIEVGQELRVTDPALAPAPPPVAAPGTAPAQGGAVVSPY